MYAIVNISKGLFMAFHKTAKEPPVFQQADHRHGQCHPEVTD